MCPNSHDDLFFTISFIVSVLYLSPSICMPSSFFYFLLSSKVCYSFINIDERDSLLNYQTFYSVTIKQNLLPKLSNFDQNPDCPIFIIWGLGNVEPQFAKIFLVCLLSPFPRELEENPVTHYSPSFQSFFL